MKKEVRESLGRKWQYYETEYFYRYIRPLGRKVSIKELEDNDKQIAKFVKNFKLPKLRKISFYTVEDRKEMKEFVGRETNGSADAGALRVFSVDIVDVHEPLHVFSFYLLGPNNLLGEGLSVYYDKWHGKEVDYWIKKFLKDGTYLPLKELMDDFKFVRKIYDDDITYPESGAFVKFIIKKYGPDKLQELYQRTVWKRPVSEGIKMFEKVLKVKFDKLEKQFINYYSK